VATSTITGIIKDASGTGIQGVTITARLRPAGFRTSDYAELVDKSTTTDVNGAWSLSLERNADISPAGTYYEIEEQVPSSSGGGRQWAINADASGALFARLLTGPPAGSTTTFLTTTLSDARYGFPYVAADRVVYLSAAGNDANSGLSPGQAKLTLQAACDLIPTNGDGHIMVGAGAFAGATITDKRLFIEGVGLGTSIGALVYNATTISVVCSGLKNLQVTGPGAGTGVTWNMAVGKEFTFVAWENVLVNSWAKDIDITSTAFDGVFTNVALEFATTGGTIRGRLTMVKPWFESDTTALDVRGNTFLTLIDPKFSGGVGTKLTSTGEFGYTPQVVQVSAEQGNHNFPTNFGVGSAKPDPANQFSDGVGLLAIANATTVPTGAPVGGGFFWVEGGILKWKGAGGGGVRIVAAGSRFGTGADGATGSFVGVGHFDDTHALVNADGSGADVSLLLRPKGAGAGVLQDAAGNNVVTATSTSKLGFYNVTPVVRPTLAVAASDLATAITLVNDIRSKLIAVGLTA
jgi:hypothetical protein